MTRKVFRFVRQTPQGRMIRIRWSLICVTAALLIGAVLLPTTAGASNKAGHLPRNRSRKLSVDQRFREGRWSPPRPR